MVYLGTDNMQMYMLFELGSWLDCNKRDKQVQRRSPLYSAVRDFRKMIVEKRTFEAFILIERSDKSPFVLLDSQNMSIRGERHASKTRDSGRTYRSGSINSQ